MKLPPLFDDLPEPFRGAFEPHAPWALLGEPLDTVLATLPERRRSHAPDNSGAHLLGERISVAADATIAPGAVIEGPAWIGPGATVRAGAYIRGGCWVGEGALVGANTELKRAILLPGAKAPHLAYVGDSILGAGVNLGAGTVLSNFRHDGKTIVIPVDGGRLDTGRRKLGAILGDGIAVGCNSVLHPGVVMGRGSQTYPGVMLRSGVYAERTLVKLKQELDAVEMEVRSLKFEV